MKVTLFPNGNLVVIARRLSPHMASPIINNFHDLQNNILHYNAITVMNIIELVWILLESKMIGIQIYTIILFYI